MPSPQTPADRDPIMEKLSKMPPDSVVCTSECADGLISESCDSKISCYNARNENGRWILTPALADQLDCAGADGVDLAASRSLCLPTDPVTCCGFCKLMVVFFCAFS